MRSVNVPTLVEGICNIIKVACGNSHSIALGSDGVAYTWGQAFYGALGVASGNSVQNIPHPQRVDLESLFDVSAGGRHSFFVTNDARVYCCGDAN